MKSYIKKPLPVQAQKLTPENRDELLEHGQASHGGMLITTPHGTTFCPFGDYIVKGTAGETYPVSAKTFEAIYDQVD